MLISKGPELQHGLRVDPVERGTVSSAAGLSLMWHFRPVLLEIEGFDNVSASQRLMKRIPASTGCEMVNT